MASVSGRTDPVVLRVTAADVIEALNTGLRDFQALPLYGLSVGALYAVGGLIIVLSMTASGMAYVTYPLASVFALLWPFAALFLYDVSRRRERGERIKRRDIWAAIRSRPEIGWMAFVSIFIFVMWIFQVRFLMALFLAHASFESMQQFIAIVLTTDDGLLFLAAGSIEGAALSFVLFSLTVVSFPLLLERDVDFVTATITGMRAMTASPVPMIGWATCVVVLLIVSALPFFIGLAVTLPVLGHTTWHLYRRIVAPLAAV
jgi:uncharacterized membrane protein